MGFSIGIQQCCGKSRGDIGVTTALLVVRTEPEKPLQSARGPVQNQLCRRLGLCYDKNIQAMGEYR